MWENTVQPDRPQMTIWRMRIACWIPKATETHPEYVIRTAFPLQQRLHERACMLRYTYIACLPMSVFLLHVDTVSELKHVQYKECSTQKKKHWHINMSCTLLYHAHNHFIHRRQVYSANRVTQSYLGLPTTKLAVWWVSNNRRQCNEADSAQFACVWLWRRSAAAWFWDRGFELRWGRGCPSVRAVKTENKLKCPFLWDAY
jgi:hypothetical protein